MVQNVAGTERIGLSHSKFSWLMVQEILDNGSNFILVLYCTLLLFVENVEGNTFYQFIAFILISLYFSSIFIIISGIFLFSLVRYFKINVDIRNLLIVFLILSQVNALVETFEKDRFEDINYNSCKKDLRTITCVEDYLETSYFE